MAGPVPVPESSASVVDVVVVTYNSAERIEECLERVESFLGGIGHRFVVVDNASADGSLELVRRHAPEALAVGNAENVGFARAVNHAMGLSEAPFALLVNPDVLEVRGDADLLLRTFAGNEKAAAVVTRMVDEDGIVQRTCHSAPTPFTMLSENLALHDRCPSWSAARRYRLLDWDMADVREVEDACGGFLMLSREAFEDVGPFDERFFMYWEETDWLQRARSKGWKVVFTPAIEVVHRAGTSSGESSEALARHLFTSQYRYVRKRFGWWSELGVRAVLGSLDLLRSAAALSPFATETRRRRAAEAWRRMPIHLGRRA